jgi:hypothetical protein
MFNDDLLSESGSGISEITSRPATEEIHLILVQEENS